MEKQVDREHILARSRAENTDEGMDDAMSRGSSLGAQVMAGVMLIVYITNLIRGESSYGELAIFWAFLAASRLPIYRFTKDKNTLFAIILYSFAVVCCLIAFFRGSR